MCSFPQSDSERASKDAEFRFLLKQKTEREKRKSFHVICLPVLVILVVVLVCVVASRSEAGHTGGGVCSKAVSCQCIDTISAIVSCHYVIGHFAHKVSA